MCVRVCVRSGVAHVRQLRKVAESLLAQLQHSGGREEWVPLPHSLLQGRERFARIHTL